MASSSARVRVLPQIPRVTRLPAKSRQKIYRPKICHGGKVDICDLQYPGACHTALSFVCSFTHLFIRSFIHSFIHSFISVHSFIIIHILNIFSIHLEESKLRVLSRFLHSPGNFFTFVTNLSSVMPLWYDFNSKQSYHNLLYYVSVFELHIGWGCGTLIWRPSTKFSHTKPLKTFELGFHG